MINKTKRNILITLLLILLLGTFLRLYLIGDESFWLDEASVALAVTHYSTSEILKSSILHGNITPGYFQGTYSDMPLYGVLLSFWAVLLGINEFSLRLFSALFGSLAILMLFLVAKELASRKVALLSSFIFSLSVFNIQYSQEARPYALMAFIALSSVYFFVKCFKTGKLIHLMLFTIFTILGLNTHFVFVFFVAFQGLYTLLMFKMNTTYVKRVLISLFLIGLSYLLWLPRFFAQNTGGAGSFLGRPSLLSVAKIWFKFGTWIFPSTELLENIRARNFLNIVILDWLLVISAFLLVFFMTVFFIFGIFNFSGNLIQRHGFLKNLGKLFNTHYPIKNKWLLFLLLWFFVPLLLELFVSIFHPTATLFGPARYLIFIFPAFILFASVGILRLKWKYSKIALVLFVMFSVLPLISYYTNVNKQQWREAVSFMEDNIRTGEIILINGPTMKAPFDYYYGMSDVIYPVYNVTQTAEILVDKESFWLILSFDKYFDPRSTIRNYVEKEFLLDKEENFFDIKILHYNRRRFLVTES